MLWVVKVKLKNDEILGSKETFLCCLTLPYEYLVFISTEIIIRLITFYDDKRLKWEISIQTNCYSAAARVSTQRRRGCHSLIKNKIH